MESLGRHILVEYLGCKPEIMDDVHSIEQEMLTAARKSGATIINSTFHHFSPLGVSGVIVIQESHLAIHTWPEFGYAAVDLFTCGDTVDPWIAFEYLNKAFGARNYSALEMRRGSIQLLEGAELKLREARLQTQEKVTPRFKRNIWFTDRDKNQALSLRYTGELLFDEKSPYHRVRVIETYAYGRALTSDNMVLCTEKDEYHYHEMMVHPVLLASGRIGNVLIIGGGDGGTAREVLRHNSVRHVDVVEIDEVIVKASKKFLPFLSESFHDKRLKLHVEDGYKYVAGLIGKSYDLIVIDGPHPSGSPKGLYSKDFFAKCYSLLSENGFLVAQGESPKFNDQLFRRIHANLASVFGQKKKFTLLFNVPTYPSGIWSFQMATKSDIDPRNIDRDHVKEFVATKKTNYYNYATHMAAFALPQYVKKMLD